MTVKVRIVPIAVDDPKRFKRCTRSLQLKYPSGYQVSKRLCIQFLAQPDMYVSGDEYGVGKTKISDISRIVGAIEDCIAFQSGLPAEFWLRGGKGIAVEPGSIVNAGV